MESQRSSLALRGISLCSPLESMSRLCPSLAVNAWAVDASQDRSLHLFLYTSLEESSLYLTIPISCVPSLRGVAWLCAIRD